MGYDPYKFQPSITFLSNNVGKSNVALFITHMLSPSSRVHTKVAVALTKIMETGP